LVGSNKKDASEENSAKVVKAAETQENFGIPKINFLKTNTINNNKIILKDN